MPVFIERININYTILIVRNVNEHNADLVSTNSMPVCIERINTMHDYQSHFLMYIMQIT